MQKYLALILCVLLPAAKSFAGSQDRSCDRLAISSHPPFAFPLPAPVASPIDTTDSDHDGLTDEEEDRYGTDPNKADTDGDGLTDGQEVKKYKTNPLKKDTDGDGLSDGDEVLKYHTNPKVVDTDGDGLNDGDEVNVYHTDPTLPDTDSDGLGDFDEINKYHTDPLKTDTDADGLTDGDEVQRLHTDPTKADTDGDGLNDGEEVNKYHTDPLRIDSDGDGLSDYDEVMETHTNPLNTDTDDDGFNDKDDACPRVAGIRETRGCPLQIGDTLAFSNIDFEKGTSRLLVSSSATLSRISTILKQFPNIFAHVVVYVDPTGNPTRDRQLSGSRANNVVNWLIGKGSVPELQVEAHAGGMATPERPGEHLELIVVKRRD